MIYMYEQHHLVTCTFYYGGTTTNEARMLGIFKLCLTLDSPAPTLRHLGPRLGHCSPPELQMEFTGVSALPRRRYSLTFSAAKTAMAVLVLMLALPI